MNLGSPGALTQVAIGEEDTRVLEFLAEHRVAVVSQVQALLGCPLRSAERRLRTLAHAGLADREAIFEGYPAACWITRRGLSWLERGLPTPRLDLKGYRHDVGVAWLWLAAQSGAFGPLDGLVSERTMRSVDRRQNGAFAGARYGIGVAGTGPRGGLSLHYPDLMLETAAGRRAALELELTAKGPRRLDGIMLGYAADARLDAVLYLCATPAIANRVQAAARRGGLDGRVQVQLLAPGSPAGVPDPGRSRERQRVRQAAGRAGWRSGLPMAER